MFALRYYLYGSAYPDRALVEVKNIALFSTLSMANS